MTSSLVGSEMCIRDRLNTMNTASLSADGESDLPNCVLKSPWPPIVTSSSVSYTHLTLPTICSV
eukprot:1737312-Prorocentrum_lima.AAC.1